MNQQTTLDQMSFLSRSHTILTKRIIHGSPAYSDSDIDRDEAAEEWINDMENEAQVGERSERGLNACLISAALRSNLSPGEFAEALTQLVTVVRGENPRLKEFCRLLWGEISADSAVQTFERFRNP